jgi:hypothetical protein
MRLLYLIPFCFNPLLLFAQPRVQHLKAYEIAIRDPLKLVRQAIRSIPANYQLHPYHHRAFYRALTTRDQDYLQLSEAVFDIYNDDLYLERVRSVSDEAGSHGLNLGMKPKDVLALDLIRQRHFLDKYHAYSLRGIVDCNGAPSYLIDFEKGSLYIDTATMAFLKVQYTLGPGDLSYGNAATKAMMAILDIHITQKQESVTAEYKRERGRYSLAKARTISVLNIRSNRRNYNFSTQTRVDYVVTSQDTTGGGKKVGNNSLIEDQNTPLEPEFWRKNTIAASDIDVEAIAALIRSKNDQRNLKKHCIGFSIDSTLDYYAQHGQFTGTALVKTGDSIFCRSYGMPADSHTQYRIGSLAKAFTAQIILQLYNVGKLQLTDTIGKFLPDYAHGNVTISQLLSHQSGIPNFTNNPEVLRDSFSLQEMVEKFCSDPLEFPSGTEFHYSNSGYVLLAYLAAVITNKSFTTLLKERIYLPAGMKDTNTQRATGYLLGSPEPAYYFTNTAGAGGIYASAADLLRWSEATLLPPNLQDSMYTPHAAYTDWQADYGYGCMIDRGLFAVTKAGHTIVYHPGTDMGFYTMYLRQPDKGNVIILLNNTGDFPRFDLADLILSQLNK